MLMDHILCSVIFLLLLPHSQVVHQFLDQLLVVMHLVLSKSTLLTPHPLFLHQFHVSLVNENQFVQKDLWREKDLALFFIGSEDCEIEGAGEALGGIWVVCGGVILGCLVFLATKFAPPLPLPLPTAGA